MPDRNEPTQSTSPERPLPEISERMEPFWAAARRGRLVIQRCERCARHYFPAVEVCSGCLSPGAIVWVEACGRGEVFSYVVMHQVYHPAFADATPYAVVDVKLDEGPRMISHVVDCAPAEIRVGMRVAVTFTPATDEIVLPMFRVSALE